MATMRQVAQRAGVSAKTVSRVMNNDRYVSDDVRRRVSEPLRICNTSPTCWLGRFGMDATPQSASLFPISLTPSFQPLFTLWRRSLGTGVLPFRDERRN